MKKKKSGDRTSVPRSARYGRSGLPISKNTKTTLKEEQMTPMLFGMRPPVEGLTVVGEATRDAQPEVVELSFDVHSAGLSAAMAFQENATKVVTIAQGLASIFNGQAELKTGGVEVWPILQGPVQQLMPISGPPLLPASLSAPIPNTAVMPAPTDGPMLIGFRASSSIKVAVRDANRVGEAVDIVMRAGAIPNGSFRFLLQDEAALERTLLEEALHGARQKANTLASAIGRTTGNPVAISEEFTAYQPQQTYGNGRHNPFVMAPWAGNILRLPFTPGQLTFSAKVSVVYQLL